MADDPTVMAPAESGGPAPGDSEDKTKLDAVSTALAGSFATVTGILGALGAVEGGLDRMLRNHWVESIVAFGLIVGAIGLAGVARSALIEPPERQRRLLVQGTIAFGLGLLIATILAVKTPSDRDRPSIAASLDPASGDLTVSVKANGLASDDRIQISVHGLYPAQLKPASADVSASKLPSSPSPSAPSEETPFETTPSPSPNGEDEKPTIARDPASLYESTLGPKPDGSIDVSLTIPLPAGTFDKIAVAARSAPEEAYSELASGEDCKRSSDEGEGCLVLALAPRSIRPRLDAVWERDGDRNVFSLNVRSHVVDYNAGVSVRVVGYGSSGALIESDLYSMLLPPDSEGVVESIAKVPVGQRVTSVCAAAVIASPTNPNQDYNALVTDGPKCPPRVVGRLTAWTHSQVPESATGSEGG